MPTERSRYVDWIAAGRNGEMGWITPERAARSSDPRTCLPDAQSVITVGLSYWAGHRGAAGPNEGKVARYAWGSDYHTVLGDRLGSLSRRLQHEFGGEHRWYVDTGPMMDKALAVRAGLGWYGKNTNVLTRELGSFVLLGEIITTLEIEPDTPLDASCGACRLCLKACPTQALGPEYTIDSRKCISYLTIEHRGPIPLEYRDLMGDWVFGCDICQDVCPPAMRPYVRGKAGYRDWAGQVRSSLQTENTYADAPRPRGEPPPEDHPLYRNGARSSVDLMWLARLSHADYAATFRGTAIKRAKVWMLRRNACIALGNVGTVETIPVVTQAMRGDDVPIVRGHAAWALGKLCRRHGSADVLRALRTTLNHEPDAYVKDEITTALGAISPGVHDH